MARARPRDLEVRHLEADLAFQSGSTSEGLKLVDDLRSDYPGTTEALSVRVSLMARHGRGRWAVKEVERWLERYPNDLRARILIARAHQMSGDPNAAIQQLEATTAFATDSLAPRVLLARAYEESNRLAEAEVVWTEARRRFPKVHAISFDLALCREKMGDIAGAEAAVRDVLALEPDNATALNFLGYLFADHNRKLDEAVDLIRAALEIDPENGAYLDSLGWVFFRLGRLDEAREPAGAGPPPLTGGDPVIHEHLGDVYKDLQATDWLASSTRRAWPRPANERRRAEAVQHSLGGNPLRPWG